MNFVQSLFAVGRCDEGVAFALQASGQQLQIVGPVIGDKDLELAAWRTGSTYGLRHVQAVEHVADNTAYLLRLHRFDKVVVNSETFGSGRQPWTVVGCNQDDVSR